MDTPPPPASMQPLDDVLQPATLDGVIPGQRLVDDDDFDGQFADEAKIFDACGSDEDEDEEEEGQDDSCLINEDEDVEAGVGMMLGAGGVGGGEVAELLRLQRLSQLQQNHDDERRHRQLVQLQTDTLTTMKSQHAELVALFERFLDRNR